MVGQEGALVVNARLSDQRLLLRQEAICRHNVKSTTQQQATTLTSTRPTTLITAFE